MNSHMDINIIEFQSVSYSIIKIIKIEIIIHYYNNLSKLYIRLEQLKLNNKKYPLLKFKTNMNFLNRKCDIKF